MQKTKKITTLHQFFRQLKDPRINRSKKHLIIDIVILSILAVLSGTESYDSIELFGKTNNAFIKQFLKLPHGITSHDTINRVFSVLNTRNFERLFIKWTNNLKEERVFKNVIAIDGKRLRGSKRYFTFKVSCSYGACLERDR